MIENAVNVSAEFLKGDVANTFYWCAAIAGTLFFVMILLFTSLGAGMDADVSDVAPDGSFDMASHIDTGFMDFQFISLKSLLAFVMMFGWTGVIWGKYGIPGFFAALGVGLFAMFMTALIVYGLMKLQHSGNVSAKDIVGAEGTVYMRIPSGRAPGGKATVKLKGQTKQVAAVSDEELPTGTPVKVLEALDDSLFLVTKI